MTFYRQAQKYANKNTKYKCEKLCSHMTLTECVNYPFDCEDWIQNYIYKLWKPPKSRQQILINVNDNKVSAIYGLFTLHVSHMLSNWKYKKQYLHMTLTGCVNLPFGCEVWIQSYISKLPKPPKSRQQILYNRSDSCIQI